MSDIQLRFVHLSDTHIHADPAYGADQSRSNVPHTTHQGARSLVKAVNNLPFQPDFILHTGDVVYDPDETAYLAAREILGELKAPVHYIPGNHDDAVMLQRILLNDTPRIPYDCEFEVNGIQLITVDSNQPFEMDTPSSRLTHEQIERLNRLTSAPDKRPLIVATHHNVLSIGSEWWDRFMRMQNGEEFHMALLAAQQRLLGVLHGHVHMLSQLTRDGITYSSTMSSWYQLACLPGQTDTVVDLSGRPSFNICTVAGGQLFIREQHYEII